MKKIDIKLIMKNIESELTTRENLILFNKSKKELLRFLREYGWNTAIRNIYKAGIFSCQGILEELRPVMDGLCEEPERGWLQQIADSIQAGLFPENFSVEETDEMKQAETFFLINYRYILEYEKSLKGYTPDNFMELLDKEEVKGLPTEEEYLRFADFWKKEYIFEYMRIAREITPFNTVGHIGGVYHIALFIGRQFQKTDVAIDLGLVSAAAAMHDLGKFGCLPEEGRRVAHLHYYYTNEVCLSRNLPMIAHIASTHSTWDLELENLSVESLILIYADFRSRSQRIDGKETIVLYTLKEAFDIILSKLENVDEAKKQRYQRVYQKLKDFEHYMIDLGFETDTSQIPPAVLHGNTLDSALLMGNDAVERIKYYSIEHNIKVMSIFNNESTFGSLLEAARTEDNWMHLRTYLDVFQEYFTYLTKQEKHMMLRFLYELLSDREGDIRRQAAHIMGVIIAGYADVYRKELPAHVKLEEKDDVLEIWTYYLKRIVFPSYRTTEQHRSWIRYTLKKLIQSTIANTSREKAVELVEVYLELFGWSKLTDRAVEALLDALVSVPEFCLDEDKYEEIIEHMAEFSLRENQTLKYSILRALEYMSTMSYRSEDAMEDVNQILSNVSEIMDRPGVRYLVYKIRRNLGLVGYIENEQIIHGMEHECRELIPAIQSQNLKVDNHWEIKNVNIEFLLDYALYNQNDNISYLFASHCANLLKVSEKVTVRNTAGRALIEVAKVLPPEQINEIVIELTKGLEIGEYQFSKYIPHYLGQLAQFLKPDDFDEFIGNLQYMINNFEEKIASVALNTVGDVISQYSEYKYKEKERREDYEARTGKMLGMLLKGMGSFREGISQAAFMVIGKFIFRNKWISEDRKFEFFSQIYKKMLTLIHDVDEDNIRLYTSAASLSSIYRFIAEYDFRHGSMDLKENDKIAFFPGTFDPFSSGHKGIVDAISKEGFETYLALDEFSWSKNTQPRMIRRNIITMSLADMTDVFLFADDFSVNIANPGDLKRLKELFPGKDIYIVVGSDVIINASSYKNEPQEHSIHSMNHIVFRRGNVEAEEGKKDALAKAYQNISGKIHEVRLPIWLEEVSSTRIRDNIDEGRDISKLIDPVAQSYIFERSLYLREPQYKSILEVKNIFIERLKECDSTIMDGMNIRYLENAPTKEKVREYLDQEGIRATVIKNEEGVVSAFAAFHLIDTGALYDEFHDIRITSYVRNKFTGRMLIIRALYINDSADMRNLLKIITNEMLSDAVEDDITYALYYPIEEKTSAMTSFVLERCGFEPISIDGERINLYEVSMKKPTIIIENIDARIKSPFNENKRILDVLQKSQAAFQKAVVNLNPGNLVLSFDSGIMNYKLVTMVTQANDVPLQPRKVRQLGENMCVPFGGILKGIRVPNTVTKSLHTEKKFDATLDNYEIVEFPMHSSIANQVTTIKSFGRKVILVDDILHKGYRMKHLDAVLKEHDVQIEKLIVGVSSGIGRDLMREQNRSMDSAYFVPNIGLWFVDATMYPFLGGDSIETDNAMEGNLIPSINLVPPFAAPAFLYNKSQSRAAVYELAETCLDNAEMIFKVLEEEYQKTFDRKLTLKRLSDVLKSPRVPNGADMVAADLNLSPLHYVQDYKNRLTRMKGGLL